MGQAPPCHRQSRMAPKRVPSPHHRRAAHQGRQANDQLDTIIVQWHGAERSPISASRTGLQS